MEQNVAETFTHKRMRIQLIQDTDTEAPEQDDGLFIVTTRNRYFELLHDKMDAAECVEDKELCKRYWVFPLRAYIHSGVALSLCGGGQFSDPWDSGQIGFVFCAKSEWRYRARDTKKRASARTAASHYVKAWNQYLSGDVWGYVVTNQEGEKVDSCWGFYGLDTARDEAKSQAEWFANKEAEDVENSPADVPMPRR